LIYNDLLYIAGGAALAILRSAKFFKRVVQVPRVVSEASVSSHRPLHGGKHASGLSQGRDQATSFEAMLDSATPETAPKKAPKADKAERPTPSHRANEADSTFLQLLTTQLKNQNPLDPLDTNQFTQQLVQFAQVEQQLKSNDQLSTLVSLQKTAQQTQALAFVGMKVAVEGKTADL